MSTYMQQEIPEPLLRVLASWIDGPVLEVGCGTGDLIRSFVELEPMEAYAIDCDRDFKFLHSHMKFSHEYFMNWILTRADLWKRIKTVMMVYPPNTPSGPSGSNMGEEVIAQLREDQILLLIAPRPYHNLTVAGTPYMWERICEEFELIERMYLTQSADVAYLLKIGNSDETRQKILEGHQVWELENQ